MRPAPPPARSKPPPGGPTRRPKKPWSTPPTATATPSKDGQAEARRAIRSGLRNGLRSPRALPDFTTSRTAPDRPQRHRAVTPSPPGQQASQPRTAAGRRAGRWQDTVPDDIRRQIQAADQAAAERRHAAIAAHQQALDRHDRSATPETAADVERTRAAAHAAHQEYTHDGRHVTGRHDAAMLRWAASITAQRQYPSAEPSAGEADSARVQANRAAVAANEAYRAGDLDQARQLTDQAAALDPSRAELWQQHRQQIDARQLILDAQAAHADGDHQRAEHAPGPGPAARPPHASPLGRQPPSPTRCPANHQARDRDMAAHEPGPTTGSGRSPAQDAAVREHHAPPATASADQEPPQPSWPSSPAHGEPHQPSAGTAQDAGGTRPSAQRHVTAAPREPRAHRGIAADDPDASADPADSGPAARWPAPNPAIAERAGPAGQHTRHEATARHEPEGRQHSGTVAEAEPGAASPERPAAAADWRDQILREARQPWQPGPAWPHNPAIERTPQADTPGAGIEPGR